MFGKNENVIFSLCSSLASVAQLVEHVFRKDGVVGSIPTAGSNMEKEKIVERIKEIEAAMQQPDFWSDKNDAQALIKELHDLKTEAEGGNSYDRGGAIVSLVAGAGGDDADDFARMLFEMYRKYFEKRGWSARILH